MADRRAVQLAFGVGAKAREARELIARAARARLAPFAAARLQGLEGRRKARNEENGETDGRERRNRRKRKEKQTGEHRPKRRRGWQKRGDDWQKRRTKNGAGPSCQRTDTGKAHRKRAWREILERDDLQDKARSAISHNYIRIQII
eukprot:5847661-Pleurochrysis_carterae.AAC.1